MLIGLVLGRVLGAPPYRGGTEIHPKTKGFTLTLLPWRRRNPTQNARIHIELATAEGAKSDPRQAISHRASYCGGNEIKPKAGGFISSLLPWRQRNQPQNEGFRIDPPTVEAPRRKDAKPNFSCSYMLFAFWAPAVWDPPSRPKIVPGGPFSNEKRVRTKTPKKIQFFTIWGRAYRVGSG